MNITLYDATGQVVLIEPAKSKSESRSIRFAAWQRQLNALAEVNPTATTAQIGLNKFTIRNGHSQWVG